MRWVILIVALGITPVADIGAADVCDSGPWCVRTSKYDAIVVSRATRTA